MAALCGDDIDEKQDGDWKYVVAIGIKEASDLKTENLTPYVKIYINGQEETDKTEAVKSPHPKWHKHFKFYLANFPLSIMFKIKDQKFILPNSVIGEDTLRFGASERKKVDESDRPVILHDGNIELHCNKGEDLAGYLQAFVMVCKRGVSIDSEPRPPKAEVDEPVRQATPAKDAKLVDGSHPVQHDKLHAPAKVEPAASGAALPAVDEKHHRKEKDVMPHGSAQDSHVPVQNKLGGTVPARHDIDTKVLNKPHDKAIDEHEHKNLDDTTPLHKHDEHAPVKSSRHSPMDQQTHGKHIPVRNKLGGTVPIGKHDETNARGSIDQHEHTKPEFAANKMPLKSDAHENIGEHGHTKHIPVRNKLGGTVPVARHDETNLHAPVDRHEHGKHTPVDNKMPLGQHGHSNYIPVRNKLGGTVPVGRHDESNLHSPAHRHEHGNLPVDNRMPLGQHGHTNYIPVRNKLGGTMPVMGKHDRTDVSREHPHHGPLLHGDEKYDGAKIADTPPLRKQEEADQFRSPSHELAGEHSRDRYTPVHNKLSGDRSADFNSRPLESTHQDMREQVHTLPAIHVHKEPVVMEKEVEYVQPVQMRQTVIHREHPKVVEKPVVVMHHEHDRTAPEVTRMAPQVVSDVKEREGNVEHQSRVLPQKEIDNKPKVIDQDVEYVQPVRVDQTVVHREHPKVVEKPVIVEHHEHHKESPQVTRLAPEIISDESKELPAKAEHHMLPEKHVENKPQIIDKDVQYVQPVQVDKTVIHREKPKIVEKPVIMEHHEHKKTAPEMVRREEPTIITENLHDNVRDSATKPNELHSDAQPGNDVPPPPSAPKEEKDVSQKQSGFLGLF